ncbi:hypothetical protein [Achromobacter xylosoxidans]|uniref:hypothetical protein n=1 Tax=Alcaligenes xylosoxydans xylosoxydans TaxID=85698 RepID=UPI00192B127C|nr:hypothetical protein [Achromobacter xylosoxidans]
MPSPSAAQVAGNVMSPDLLDGLMRDCAGRMSTTAPGGELVGAAEKGDHHSQRIVEHFAVVDAMLEAASKEVLALTDMKPWLLKGPELRGHRAESMRPLSEEKANGFRKEIENLKAQRDALYKPVWKLAEGVMDAAAKGKDHANWDSHHPNGGPLRKKVIRPANELTKGMAQLAKGLREARFPDVAKGAAGQHLYDLVVEHVTIPGFAEKKGCKPEDVWGQYLDPNRYDSNRIGCADVGKKHLSTSFNEMSFMAVHVESALRLYKEPALDTLQPPADQRAPAPIDAEPRDINVTPRPAEGAPEANSGVDRAGAGSVNVNISFKDNLFYIGGDKNTVSNDASTSSDGAERQRPAAASAGSATDLFKSMSAVRSEPKPDERPSETAFDYRSGDGVYTFTFTPSPRPMGEPVGTAQPAGSARVESDPERVEATSDEAGGHEEFVTLPDRQTSPQPGIALGLQAPAGAAPQLQGQVSPTPSVNGGSPNLSSAPSEGLSRAVSGTEGPHATSDGVRKFKPVDVPNLLSRHTSPKPGRDPGLQAPAGAAPQLQGQVSPTPSVNGGSPNLSSAPSEGLSRAVSGTEGPHATSDGVRKFKPVDVPNLLSRQVSPKPGRDPGLQAPAGAAPQLQGQVSPVPDTSEGLPYQSQEPSEGLSRAVSGTERPHATSDGVREFKPVEAPNLLSRQASPKPGRDPGLQAPAGAAPQLQGQVSPVPDTSEGLPYQSQEPSEGLSRTVSGAEGPHATSDGVREFKPVEAPNLLSRQVSPKPGRDPGLQAPAGAASQLQGQVSPVPDTSEGLPYQSQEPSDKRVASWSDSQARARRAARGDSDESPKSVGPASPHQLPSRPIGDDMAQEWPRRERRVSADSPAEMTDPAGMPTMHENSRDMNPKASLATVVRDGPRDSTQQFGLSSEDAEPQRETASPVRSWSAASSSKDSLDGWPASANSIDSGMRPTTPPGLARLAEPKNQPDPGWTGGRPDRGAWSSGSEKVILSNEGLRSNAQWSYDFGKPRPRKQ